MKAGDLVHMPGETVREGEVPGIGIIIHEEDFRTHRSWPGKSKRVGVLWAGWHCVEWEPSEWLEVISETVES